MADIYENDEEVTEETKGFSVTPIIANFAQVLMPEEAEPPVLSTAVRGAIRQWMIEIGAHDELKEAGLKPRTSCLLSGPPGCGKTTLAHHFAQRLGLPLVLVDMHRVVSKWVGESSNNIGALFSDVNKQHDRCILFLDEFDAVATKRMEARQGSDKERNSIVIAILQSIDSFKGTLIAATNRADDIDEAIWRRFGMQLEILEPDDDARFAILKRYLAPFSLPDESLAAISLVTAGASPAVLRALMEGVKRDLILCPRYNQSIDLEPIFQRLIASCRPHASSNMPTLWAKSEWALEQIAGIKWPPSRQEKKAA